MSCGLVRSESNTNLLCEVLLDESVPVQVRAALSGHQLLTAVEMEWRGIGNGELLDRSESDGFELLIVADKNFQYQQI